MENLFPSEIRKAVASIDNEERQKILSYLILHGSSGYSELKNDLDLTKGNMNYHLNSLVTGGLLSHFVESDQVRTQNYTSFYEISEFGKSFINSVMSSLYPQEERAMSNELPNIRWDWMDVMVPAVAGYCVLPTSTLVAEIYGNTSANIKTSYEEEPIEIIMTARKSINKNNEN